MLRYLPITVLLLGVLAERPADCSEYFEIRITDQQTGRGIPLVELVTVDSVRFVTDNAGRVAYHGPATVGQTVFFHIHPQGYEVPRDGLGSAGVRLKIEPGKTAEVKLRRINLAERLYRVTGRARYRDSVLLGREVPRHEPLGAGRVIGQDSVQVAPYRGRLYWFWGDTNRLSYPLGLFRTAGATSLRPEEGGLSPLSGIDFKYFTGEDGFVRAMVDVANPKGVVWIDGVCTVPDEDGRERLVARFSRRPGLEKAYEQGMMVYNDDREVFEVATNLPLHETWRMLQSHPARVAIDDVEYLVCGHPFLLTRVPAAISSVMDPNKYESWSCIEPGADPATASPRRAETGALDWRWQSGPPITQHQEKRWLEAGLIRPSETRLLPVDAANDTRRVIMHSGTVHWNAYRKRWILVAVEQSFDRQSPSFLGEVWYSEAPSAQGPFKRAVKIVTHDKQSFYNPAQHPFFDADDGRFIYFEGTYCNTFTSSPATPRYNYNQVMYRLDLALAGPKCETQGSPQTPKRREPE